MSSHSENIPSRQISVYRRAFIQGYLKSGLCYMTLSAYPRLGANETAFDTGTSTSDIEVQRSQFISDDTINPHPRYRSIVANIRSRRGRKVETNVPIYRDLRTAWPFWDPTVNYDLQRWPEDDDVRSGAVKENHVYMDASMFASVCSLEVTVQAKNLSEGRKLYDHLLQMGPILLALTAATPIAKGYLVDTDVRWSIHALSVDDRTPEELGDKAWELGDKACTESSITYRSAY